MRRAGRSFVREEEPSGPKARPSGEIYYSSISKYAYNDVLKSREEEAALRLSLYPPIVTELLSGFHFLLESTQLRILKKIVDAKGTCT